MPLICMYHAVNWHLRHNQERSDVGRDTTVDGHEPFGHQRQAFQNQHSGILHIILLYDARLYPQYVNVEKIVLKGNKMKTHFFVCTVWVIYENDTLETKPFLPFIETGWCWTRTCAWPLLKPETVPVSGIKTAGWISPLCRFEYAEPKYGKSQSTLMNCWIRCEPLGWPLTGALQRCPQQVLGQCWGFCTFQLFQSW